MKQTITCIFYKSLFTVVFVLIHVWAFSTTITSVDDGNWNDATVWNPSQVPSKDDDVIVVDTVTIDVGQTVYVNSIVIDPHGVLNIYGNLIVMTDLTMGNSENYTPELNTGSQSSVTVLRNAVLGNKVNLDLSSYFIVVGSFSKSGSAGQGSATAEGAHIYVFSEFDSPWTNLNECNSQGYSGTTSSSDSDCDVGKFDDFIDIVDPEDLPDGVYEEILDKELTYSNSLDASPAVICAGGFSTLILSATDPQKISWYLNGSRIAKDSEPTRVVTTEGDYYAVYKNSLGWYKTNTVTLTEQEALELPELVSNYVGGCVPEIPDYDTFINASTQFPDIFQSNGSVNSSCLSATVSSLTSSDVYVGESCPKTVERTYTLTLSDGSTFTATQNLILVDNTAPVINGGSPLNSITATADPANCLAEISVPFDFTANNVTDNCDLTNTEAAYSFYPGDDPGAELVSGAGNITNYSFPVGTTTVSWTVSDFCDNNSEPVIQVIEVSSPVLITPISYDGTYAEADNGPGMNPIQTSTHTYQVDGGITESGYTYTWELVGANNTGFVLTGQGTASISLEYASPTDTISAGPYMLKVIKESNSGGCTNSVSLPIEVVDISLFNVEMDILGDQCQTPSSSTTTYFWTITFPSGFDTEPFRFDYELTIDGTTVLTGTIGSITSTGTWAWTPANGTAPFVQTSKTTGYQVELRFTFPVSPENELPIGLKINVSDAYQVSVPEITNDFKANRIPTISFD